MISQHAFNAAVDDTLERCLGVSNQRGGEYEDSWAISNVKATFQDLAVREILRRNEAGFSALSPQEKRLITIACLCDVKISRLGGAWKADSVDDLINYLAALRRWMEDYTSAPRGRPGCIGHSSLLEVP